MPLSFLDCLYKLSASSVGLIVIEKEERKAVKKYKKFSGVVSSPSVRNNRTMMAGMIRR
jgi:hypothetical protein